MLFRDFEMVLTCPKIYSRLSRFLLFLTIKLMIYEKKNYPDIMSKHRWDLVGHYANFGRPMSKDRLLFAGGRNLLDNTQMSRG